ncbi:MAG: phospholipid scramblase 1 [Watsoniomyces obsoletus]|nr:MAG: phospholipid scramblase 1 [Watsoniomyces obsoletus]
MVQLGTLSPAGSVLIGVLVGLIATSVQSIGLTLQRKSHILEDEKALQDTHAQRPPYRRRRWQLGMLMFVVSNILGSTIQITTLPLPVLSTLQASGLVFNAICATIILGEPFTRWSFGGTSLVCIGAVLIATFGAMKEPAHTLDQLLYLLERRAFIGWMIGQGILVGLILALAKFIKIMDPKTKHHPRKRLARGIAYGCIRLP